MKYKLIIIILLICLIFGNAIGINFLHKRIQEENIKIEQLKKEIELNRVLSITVLKGLIEINKKLPAGMQI
jgi:hypothetical protein